jgi:hypothetical protein
MKKVIIAVGVLAPLVAVWIFWGRFAVEGGRAKWAVINDRPDVLAEALKEKLDDNTKRDCLGRAISNKNAEEVKLLLAAGATPNPPARGFCMLGSSARWGDVDGVSTILQAGGDPKLCGDQGEIVRNLVQYGADRAPQGELIRVIRILLERGAPVANAAPIARQRKLDQVALFLDNPSAAPADDKPVPKLARLGTGDKVGWNDFKQVCSGKGLAGLPAYQKQEGLVSPLVLLEQRSGDPFFPSGPESILPRWWTAAEDLRQTQVVACAKIVEKKVARECHYEGRGGGISIYDATYELSAYEAKTGRVIAEKTVPMRAASTECTIVKFGQQQEGVYPKYGAELAALVAPLIGAP